MCVCVCVCRRQRHVTLAPSRRDDWREARAHHVVTRPVWAGACAGSNQLGKNKERIQVGTQMGELDGSHKAIRKASQGMSARTRI